MAVKSEKNQILGGESKYIVVGLADSRKIILPAADGFQLIEIMSRGLEVEEDWKNDYKLKIKVNHRDTNDLRIRFISEKEIKIIQFEEVVESEEEDS